MLHYFELHKRINHLTPPWILATMVLCVNAAEETLSSLHQLSPQVQSQLILRFIRLFTE